MPSTIPALDEHADSILSHSWHDLQLLSESPHPYGSRANDKVHDYILQRVRSIVGHENAKINATVDEDMRPYLFRQDDVFDSSLPSGRVLYYESNNILVKVPGSDPSLPGVLVSAHYDSVPTAYGTTDDGAGIASMLGMLEAILHNNNDNTLPLRTIVFNFNNNEEFGLLGAESFFEHHWSKEVEFFVNLEGAGAGGRAVLFRGTDLSVVKHFASSRAPHGNSILQHGFDSRLINSETDYKIYSRNGLRGLDIAFYTPRNIYHTKDDSIQGISKEALYHMYGNALDSTLSLANAAEDSLDNCDRVVYFDILGRYFYVLSLPILFQMDIILLLLFPAITISL
ncbi:Zn-dependent exopeptidase, partial [Nadsonia fulvescens var. elongata DSM 6958]